MADTVLKISDLKVSFSTHDGMLEAVKGASFEVSAGETIAIVGESGSGKSQSMMAVMGLLPKNGQASGQAIYEGQNLIGMPKAKLNAIRGKKITMIFQEPMTSLDPLYRIGSQMMEPIRRHLGLKGKDAAARAIELLRLVKIPEPERRLRSYPHELSGGQRQRVMIALALANNPDVLIADEPTTALDVTIQAEILDLLADLQKRLGMALVFITHDLGIVRRIASRVYVMQGGEVVEHGDTRQIFAKPQHEYTKVLLAAEPRGRKAAVAADAPMMLSGDEMRVTFRLGGGLFGGPAHEINAVNHVNISLRKGQTIGLVGESGSGKSTLARALLRLLPAQGHVVFQGVDISKSDAASLRSLRKELQIVFQDPFGSLSPRLTVGQIISEGLLVHEPSVSKAERDRRAILAMREVGLDPETRNRYPHEFSGGQRQRIAIARAMILHPKVVILDEPTSALDRQVQSQIVELLRRLQAEKALSYLFISHDLAVVRAMADTVMVMRNGQVVEQGTTEQVMSNPQSDYTKLLMRAAFSNLGQPNQH
jgi:ABC-type microcin C transport system duplicated ATPase subunit YejF